MAKRLVTKIYCGLIIATSHIIQETYVGSYMESLKGGAKGTKSPSNNGHNLEVMTESRIKLLGALGI